METVAAHKQELQEEVQAAQASARVLNRVIAKLRVENCMGKCISCLVMGGGDWVDSFEALLIRAWVFLFQMDVRCTRLQQLHAMQSQHACADVRKRSHMHVRV